MRRTVLSVFLFVFILLSCDEQTIDDNYIEIKQAIPSPARVGDTLNILLTNINSLLNVSSIEQVKVLLDENNKTYIFQATGYYDQFPVKEYGHFFHSKLIDSLIALHYVPVIQCIIDSSYPGQSKIGVQLNEKILRSNIILNINK
ncbi:hypothetical protein ACSSV9_14460 [Melioribacter sp. OK-6-Me]|uniref:hypothetical protein n=1 Tax=Melioribacter sp. OK-6-Me TaxID=3423433 RepID=UPI003ED9BE09